MDSVFCYNFPALRGIQAGNEYYIAMCPLKLIPRIFLFDEKEIPPEYRAQRILNRSRIPDITNYLVNHHDEYVLSSLTASIDGEMEFRPFSTEFKDIGRLSISLDSKFLINDGQHRRAAIEEALKISPHLGEETISVVFYRDQGLRKSQQMFADLNRHAVTTTSSLGILYDHRDQLSMITKDVIDSIPLLDRYTDREKVSLSKYSPKMFTLNSIYNSNCNLIGKRKGSEVSSDEEQFIRDYWTTLSQSITEWQLVFKSKIAPRELRFNYIVGHGIFLEAIGILGNYLFTYHRDQWTDYLTKLSHIDWSRSNDEWLGRAFSRTGRINKNRETILLTSNLIKMKIGLSLLDQELKIEEKSKEE